MRISILFLLASVASVTSLAAEEFKTLAVVRELDQVNVPAQQEGVIAELHVRRGHRVAAEQIISELDKTEINLRLDVAQAELRQAEAKAENDGPIATAEAAVRRAEKEGELLNELGENAIYLERFRMRNTLEKSVAELRSTKNQRVQDRVQVDVKANQVKLLEYEKRLSSVRSPYDGIVIELLKHRGEWVRKGDALVKITRMDKLLAEGFLDSRHVSPHSTIGAATKVTIELTNGTPLEFDGLVIEHPAPKIELDGKFPVWVEFKNSLVEDRYGHEQWLIRPGMNGTMTVKLNHNRL